MRAFIKSQDEKVWRAIVVGWSRPTKNDDEGNAKQVPSARNLYRNNGERPRRLGNSGATTTHATAQTTIGHGTTGQNDVAGQTTTGLTTHATTARGDSTNSATKRANTRNFVLPNEGMSQTQTTQGLGIFN
uniref:Uncharacterized protein n=1 Tax=Cannabis sativa TaxID=3483 RepID=A0A803NJB3_CANSA